MIGVYIYSQQGIKNPLELEDSSWKVFKVYEGNLDKNRWVDLVVVLQNETLPKENEFTGVPRRLVILKGKFFNRYKLLSQSDSALLCRECGGLFGDPFDSVEISPMSIILGHYGGSNWRWGRVDKYEYDGERFLLVETKDFSYHTSIEGSATSTTKTPKDFGVIYLEDFDINKTI